MSCRCSHSHLYCQVPICTAKFPVAQLKPLAATGVVANHALDDLHVTWPSLQVPSASWPAAKLPFVLQISQLPH